jgi:hypothetical protein
MGSPERNGTADLGSAWHELAEQLARWTMGRLVNRTDRFGAHYIDPETRKVKRYADPADEAKAREGHLDLGRLVRHFQATETEHVIGAFSYGGDKRGRWTLTDIDNHDDSPALATANERYALHLHALCCDLGLSALLCDTNGRGSFHLWTIFNRPVPAAVLRAFGLWLVHDHGEHGLEKPPEVFPKNDGDTPWGSWVRLPGRHHKSDAWARVWNGAGWLEGETAARYVLSLVGSDPDLIPTTAAAHGATTETGHDPREKGTPDSESDSLEAWQDYNRKTTAEDVAELLEKHDWTRGKKRKDGAVGFIRPEKDKGDGEGGNLLVCDGVPVFYCFTDGAPPLEPHRGYAPAALFALLECGGDFKASNRALYEKGFGSRVKVNSGGGQTGGSQQREFKLGSLTLRPGTAHVSPAGKMSVPLAVVRDGRPIDHATLTSSANGRATVLRLLAGYLPGGFNRAEISSVLGEILAAAVPDPAAEVTATGPDVRSVVRSFVPGALELAFRTDRGFWSERRGCELTRGDLLAYTPEKLMEAASAAADAPPTRTGLLGAVRAELEILYADLADMLPRQHQGGVVPEGSAADRFRSALVSLWTATRTFEVSKTEGGDVASRTSLAMRARDAAEKAKERNQVPSGRWHESQRSFHGWWRVAVADGGEVVTLLAMRWTLAGQVGVVLPGVCDQASLTAIGTAAGCIDPDPPVPDRLTGGQRLVVLSAGLRDEMLAVAEEDPRGQPSDTEGGVSPDG